MKSIYLYKEFLSAIALSCLLAIPLNGQNSKISIIPGITRSVGGITEVDRSRYFRIHSMEEDNDHLEFYNEYNVGFPGRTFYGPGEVARNLTGEVGNYNVEATLDEHLDWAAYDVWKLNTSEKNVTISADWKKAVWEKGINSSIGDSITIKVKLFLHGSITTNSTIFNAGLTSSSNPDGGSSNCVYLSKISGLAMRSDNNTPLDKVINFNLEDAAGDSLEIQVKYLINFDASSSKVSTRLINLVDGDTTDWGSYTGLKQEVFNAMTTGQVYFKMLTGEMVKAGVTQADVLEVKIGEYKSDFSGLGELNTVLPVKRYVRCSKPEHSFKEGLNMDDVTSFSSRFFKFILDKSYIPEFYEPMNEPFVHAKDFYNEPDWTDYAEARVKLQMAEYHIAIAKAIHQSPELANIKIAGYTSAWPEFDRNNFDVWRENMKMFMDTAGLYMDAFSTHIYDGINVIGNESRRSGSNMIAVLDMIESYSYSKWGVVKPHVISEYGATTNDEEFSSTYSDIKNAQAIRSQNSIIFELFEREDRLGISIPFTVGKATWHIAEAYNYEPYTSILFKPIPMRVPLEQVTGWEYTPRIHFFDLWKDVQGKRINIKSENPDILAQAFLNNNEIIVALNNLEDYSQTIDLRMIGQLPNLSEVIKKSLIIYDDKLPSFTIETLSKAPSTLTLENSETVVMKYVFDGNIPLTGHLSSSNYYSEKVLEAIEATKTLEYTFNSVDEGPGFAVLKMSIGRAHELSKSPVVTVNDSIVNVPANWKGYNQSPRQVFFGTIEIPIPSHLIQVDNSISITFPDDGGYISSVVLNVEVMESVSESIEIVDVTGFTEADTSLYFSVWHQCAEKRDILINLMDSDGKELIQKRISREAGLATDNLKLDLGFTLMAGASYNLYSYLLPVGAGIIDKIAIDSAQILVRRPITVTVLVRDKDDKLPIANAGVHFNDSIKYTDVNGTATFYKVPYTGSSLRINKESYETVDILTRQIQNDTTITSFLTPVKYSVLLTLRDSSTLTYIGDAKVTLNKEEKTTLSNGLVYFTIKTGRYPISIQHDYYSLHDSITITRDLDSICMLSKSYTDWKVSVLRNNEPFADAKILVGNQQQTTNSFGKSTFYHLKIDSAYYVVVSKDGVLLFEDTVKIADNEIYTIYIEPVSAENQFTDSEFILYPNPVNEQLTLELTEFVSELSITNTSGVIFDLEHTFGESKKNIDVSHLDPGIYILKFLARNSIQVMRFIKL